MNKWILILLFLSSCIFFRCKAQCFSCASAPLGTIWCDDFEDTIPLNKKYFEYDNNNGDFVPVKGIGRNGTTGMRVIFQQGEISAGNIKKSFGRTPDSYIGKYAVMPALDFNEIYWRIDIRLQAGWTGGGGDKLTRALCLANSNWAEGSMAHLWSGTASNFLVMDPASGIDVNGNLVSTKYNDFANLRWLGAKTGSIDIFSTANSGRWFCVEGHEKLNTPGKSDGIFEFWINDTLQAQSTNLNWHGTWNSNPSNYKINTILFENYWNAGSPVLQERYFDNIVISTKRIGCNCSTGVSEDLQISSIAEVNVFPNPFHRVTTFTIRNSAGGTSAFSLYDLTGRELRSFQFNGSSLRIERDGLPAGIYFYKIRASNGTILNGKINIQ
jgi:hypothetical protein